MASFEKKVSEIFDETPRLARKIPFVIRKMFQESDAEFKRRIRNMPEDAQQSEFLKLFDVLFIDCYFTELNNRFMSWVIEHHAERFTEEELEEMRAQALSHLDFYEVLHVYPGKGCDIKSILTDESGFLRDVSSSRVLVKWDIIMSRCYRFRGDYLATGSLTLFRPDDKEYIIRTIKEALARSAHDTEVSYAFFAKTNWDMYYQIERDITEKAMNRKVYTKYGELQLCEVRFQVHELQTILKTIDTCDEFDFVETRERQASQKRKKIKRYQYDWLTLGIEEELKPLETINMENGVIFHTSQLDMAGNQTGIDLIGSLYVDQFLVRLETRSLDLAEFAVRHFETIFKKALTFKRIVNIKMDSGAVQKNVKENEKPVAPKHPNPDLIREIREKYYLELLDEKIPQLKNKSPREARHDTEAYPLLVNWLKGLENMIERSQQRNDVYFSIDLIKKELNIDW